LVISQWFLAWSEAVGVQEGTLAKSGEGLLEEAAWEV
jgi:hypothetical protein